MVRSVGEQLPCHGGAGQRRGSLPAAPERQQLVRSPAGGGLRLPGRWLRGRTRGEQQSDRPASAAAVLVAGMRPWA